MGLMGSGEVSPVRSFCSTSRRGQHPRARRGPDPVGVAMSCKNQDWRNLAQRRKNAPHLVHSTVGSTGKPLSNPAQIPVARGMSSVSAMNKGPGVGGTSVWVITAPLLIAMMEAA